MEIDKVVNQEPRVTITTSLVDIEYKKISKDAHKLMDQTSAEHLNMYNSIVHQMKVSCKKGEDLFYKYKKYFSLREAHFAYETLQEAYYKQREKNPKFIEEAKRVCLLDLELIKRETLDEWVMEWSKLPCIQRLINIYEKESDYVSAIELCKTFYGQATTIGIYCTKKLQTLNKKVVTLRS